MDSFWQVTAILNAFLWGVYFLVAWFLWWHSRDKNPPQKEFDRRVIQKMGCAIGLVIIITQFALYINPLPFSNPFFWVAAAVYMAGVFGHFWMTDYCLLEKSQLTQKG